MNLPETGLYKLFDCEFAFLAILADGLVDATIGAAADEANDVVFFADMDLARVPTSGGPLVICICMKSAVDAQNRIF